jgi:hypothetical protein
MPFDKTGYLTVNITTAGGSLPRENVLVRVQGADENNRDVTYSFLSDIDGVGRKVALPAPSRSFSLSPGAPEQSFALYDITAAVEGYYPIRIIDVAVFDGETTVLPINLIPLPIHNNNAYPRGNLYVRSGENEMLE